MILVSLGNLGDLLIQAAFLRRFDRSDVRVAVPTAYASIASELFPHAAVITLSDQLSDGRLLAEAQIDRATAVARILESLSAAYPGVPVRSIALTDDVIHQRALNIYEAYWQVLGRNPDIRARLSPTTFPRKVDDWRPFEHLAQWKQEAATKTVYVCPWGGIGVKNVDASTLDSLADFAVSLGYEVRLLVSPRDAADKYWSPIQIVRLSETGIIADAVGQLTSAALVVAVDTAWYHLAALIGAPVLGIGGPRSLSHFEFPGRKRSTSVDARRLCADCFSSDRCVVTWNLHCEARPDATQIVAAMQANLAGAPVPIVRSAPQAAAPKSRLQRALWRARFRLGLA